MYNYCQKAALVTTIKSKCEVAAITSPHILSNKTPTPQWENALVTIQHVSDVKTWTDTQGNLEGCDSMLKVSKYFTIPECEAEVESATYFNKTVTALVLDDWKTVGTFTKTLRDNLGAACETDKNALITSITDNTNTKCASEKNSGVLLNSDKNFAQLQSAEDWAGLIKLDTYCKKAVSVAAIVNNCEAAALTHPDIMSGNTPNQAW